MSAEINCNDALNEPLKEIDEPLFERENRIGLMPRIKEVEYKKSVLNYLSESRAIKLLCIVFGLLIFLVAVDITLSAFNVNYENTLLKDIFQTGKLVVTTVLGYVFGSRANK